MVTKPALIDPLESVFGPADEVAAGLAQLEQGPPLWGDPTEWIDLVRRLRAFETPAGARARLAGWTLPQLYRLDPVAPRARVGRMGAAFLIARAGAGKRYVIASRTSVSSRRISWLSKSRLPCLFPGR
jgi:hypothetical protein